MNDATTTLDPADDVVAVDYKSNTSNSEYLFWLAAIYAVIVIALTQFQAQQETLILLGVVTFVVGLVATELWLTNRAIEADKPALVISSEGVGGMQGYRTRFYNWEEIDAIYTESESLFIARKPKSAFERFNHFFARSIGCRPRFEEAIVVPLKRVNMSKSEIELSLNYLAPAESEYSDANWSIPRNRRIHDYSGSFWSS